MSTLSELQSLLPSVPNYVLEAICDEREEGSEEAMVFLVGRILHYRDAEAEPSGLVSTGEYYYGNTF